MMLLNVQTAKSGATARPKPALIENADNNPAIGNPHHYSTSASLICLGHQLIQSVSEIRQNVARKRYRYKLPRHLPRCRIYMLQPDDNLLASEREKWL
jgi:hypothetical protein